MRYALERAKFRKEQFEILIRAAEGCGKDVKTVERRVLLWKKQIKKLNANIQRFEAILA